MPDVTALSRQMTLEEKAALCTGANVDDDARWNDWACRNSVSDGRTACIRRTIHAVAAQSCRPPSSPPPRCWRPPGMRNCCQAMGEALATEAVALA